MTGESQKARIARWHRKIVAVGVARRQAENEAMGADEEPVRVCRPSNGRLDGYAIAGRYQQFRQRAPFYRPGCGGRS